MNQDQSSAPDAQESARSSGSTAVPSPHAARSVVWPVVAVGALLLGLLVGYNAPGRTPAAAPAPEETSSMSTSVSPRATSGDATVAARAQVNAACIRSLNDAQNVYLVLSGLNTAVDDVDLKQLDQMVRDLQPLQTLLQRDLSECEVDTSIADGQSEAPPPTPTDTSEPVVITTVTASPSATSSTSTTATATATLEPASTGAGASSPSASVAPTTTQG